ncbi:DoxX family protein [Aquibacillus koreensis]|uniref:DoxX family protein n=1 Tax=Aquibacillus koreensis TaxID=279446 RepID=A0A9X3WLN6_9BACI|nr:DoxX family protein [Aquibacillus koreensis]MCT2537860.1 DoxX family protein [Aquibacillus koreensis]MDC3421108.1 DoxX family protein [Aquibacillus koreensis]
MKQLSSMKLIRYVVGYVFIASAILKLLVPDFETAFASYGLPYPEVTVLIVAIMELICGGLLIFDYYVKQATIPLLVIIVIAILLTKIPVLHAGFFQFAFEARLDIVLLALLYIIWRSYK